MNYHYEIKLIAAEKYHYIKKENLPACAFTIDVEDWRQSCVNFDLPISENVLWNTDVILNILNDLNLKATFFIQGMVAEAFPQLLNTLIKEGHEIQSHAYSHRPLYKMNPQEFKKEIEYSRKSVEDACGVSVNTFRAPDFSILSSNLWALSILVEMGFHIDSSIFPFAARRYGIPGWEHRPHWICFEKDLQMIEIPVAFWHFGKWKIPISGGGYFRFAPFFLTAWAYKQILKKNLPIIFYCHPYEFNSKEIYQYKNAVPYSYLLKQNYGRKHTESKIRSLLSAFHFDRLDNVLKAWKIL